MSTTFENAKIGDKVYSTVLGWGEIESIDMSNSYPILVRFFHDNSSTGYTIEGYYYSNIPIQSLFWDEVVIEAPKKPIGVKMVNGVEIPDISFNPDSYIDYYTPLPTHPGLYRHAYYIPNETNVHLSTNGLCYPFTEEGKRVAIMHAKAMLGIC
jgi:hypothetical protein